MLNIILFTAFVTRSFVLLSAYDFVYRWVDLRKHNDLFFHVLCAVVAYVAGRWIFHSDLRNTLGAAFVADFVLHLREMLEIVVFMCQAWSELRTRRRH